MTPTKKSDDKPTKKKAASPAAAAKKAPAKKKATGKKAIAKKASAEAGKAERPIGNYVYALGRRKEASAQTRLYLEGSGKLTVNGKKFDVYFSTLEQRQALLDPLLAAGRDKSVDVDFRIMGGGLKGQAEAARLGLSRALLKLDPELRQTLKALGYLTRDAREKERKKYGLKKARRAPQWAKR